MSDQPNNRTQLTRREWMKTAASAGAAALASNGAFKALEASPALLPDVASPRPARPESKPPQWTGHNRQLEKYYLAPGYPAYDPHARYLGELRGSWYDIGKQYGERAGDLMRMVYEGWYQELCCPFKVVRKRWPLTLTTRTPTTKRWCQNPLR